MKRNDTWQKEWKDMPEFHQEDLTAYRKLFVHFRSEEDVQKFAELLGQTITPKQKAIWFPVWEKRRYADKRYIDES